jgi:hypothetical protein
MERDREAGKLTSVLRRVARSATHAAWTRNPEASRFCVLQYNKILARLSEIEPAAAALFTALPETASPDVTRIAAHELAAYFDDDPVADAPHVRIRYHGCGGRRAWAGVVRAGSRR